MSAPVQVKERYSPARKTHQLSDGTWQVWCRIDQLNSTDHPRVKTATLACGLQIRFDLDQRQRGRFQRAVVCPNCTALLRLKKRIEQGGER